MTGTTGPGKTTLPTSNVTFDTARLNDEDPNHHHHHNNHDHRPPAGRRRRRRAAPRRDCDGAHSSP
ncbi:MAG: hypothetical protein GY772_04625 [bacterium]|nr:hypothetical protein [bacterium]